MVKCSRKFVNTLDLISLRSYLSQCKLTLRFIKIILWTVFIFSETTADFRRQELSETSVFERSRLNSSYQSIIVDFPDLESTYRLSSHCLASAVHFPIKKQYPPFKNNVIINNPINTNSVKYPCITYVIIHGVCTAINMAIRYPISYCNTSRLTLCAKGTNASYYIKAKRVHVIIL